MKKKIRKKLLGFDVSMTYYSTLEEDEEDLVGEYFRLPRGAETGEFMRTAVAKQLLSAPDMNLSTVALGRAFTHLGFKAAPSITIADTMWYASCQRSASSVPYRWPMML